MKYQVTPAFEGDWSRLSEPERGRFREVVRSQFHPACERYHDDPSTRWPQSLRIKQIEGAPGIWEMTWSFSGTDGRATFEWIGNDDEPAIRWRRVGGHAIFHDP